MVKMVIETKENLGPQVDVFAPEEYIADDFKSAIEFVLQLKDFDKLYSIRIDELEIKDIRQGRYQH